MADAGLPSLVSELLISNIGKCSTDPMQYTERIRRGCASIPVGLSHRVAYARESQRAKVVTQV